MLNPYFRFEYVTDDNRGNFAALATLTNTYMTQINSFGGAEFDSELSKLQRDLFTNGIVSGLISKEPTDEVSDTMYMELEMYLKTK